ncbi:MAG: SEC-C metal-binding domain-containing protein [Proteobacteria bacterium]|nr:SEC-C metal-binding domain-containing protein [Pseudomonadota bacterium]
MISQKVVDEWNLKPIGMAQVHSVTETKLCETFLVSILLPNKVIMPAVRVTKGELVGCDVLIGMDIIARGDFAVTNKDGKTTFSFRLPSIEEIDFVTRKTEPIHSTKISRNSPCPCGSGRKYKKCCGKNTV